LDDFFSEVEAATENPKLRTESPEDQDDSKNRIKIHLNDLGTSASQIDRLLQTNYEWKNLNPFYVLDIPHTVDNESIISARYRALSLLVHPDKNAEDVIRAKAAFEQVKKAMEQMNDETKRRHLSQLVEQGYKQGKRDWEEELAKNPNASASMSEKEKQDGLSSSQNKATMKIFASIEAKRRDVERRKRKFEQRERAQEDEEKEREKKERDHDKNWREVGRVEKRVGNWRDFQKKKG
jgi:DnaJ family protein C protein 8